MRLILLSCLTMVAFAANSILNRLALAEGAAGPASFAAIRLVVGAGVLAVLILARGRPDFGRIVQPGWGMASLLAYMLGFSFAYTQLDAGIGALILFGGVQITMFAGAVLTREAIPVMRWAGAGVAFSGLVVLLWPGAETSLPLFGAAMMAIAAVGWGIYSLLGRRQSDPLLSTASAFVLAAPIGLLALLILPDSISWWGVLLAAISGGVTSALGYALWYSILPALGAARGAVLQLSVPAIATAGGVLFLNEGVGLRFLIASALVLGGVALSMRRA
ncbi:membrane protein [Actibacterium mucosum KCTC 23349]|uniref:Membrane protein n=1 Tax=Actibacterium mucosum KCTC 23349 TaxID=1454373 RepID=A0A037ZG79_9RHOB|nr:DMT family transporter [Actibacterium mucosum]KAJ55153.1 membrane protein [Actibacterium mucosum KCTC 23349]